MGMNEKLDFAMERRLRDLSPELHRRFTEAVFGLQNILTKYQKVFPLSISAITSSATRSAA